MTGMVCRVKLLAACFGVLMAWPLWAAPPAVMEKHDSSQPVHITSKRLQADGVLNRVRFIGEVEARQGDVVIYAPEMVLYFQEQTRDIEKVEAFPGVRVVQGGRVATGNKGVYFAAESKIVLTGSAHVRRGEDSLEGDEIVIFLNGERSIVTSKEGARVKAVFHPKGDRP
ncbi:MAG: lipopolysaccharide transport periplasmic protein LptA [Desulfuromonadaceae bacterium]|nr:lipopolysaccharide transport periplasmic protein LptA [Desulfuromonadaceae bacterium]